MSQLLTVGLKSSTESYLFVRTSNVVTFNYIWTVMGFPNRKRVKSHFNLIYNIAITSTKSIKSVVTTYPQGSYDCPLIFSYQQNITPEALEERYFVKFNGVAYFFIII